MSVKDHGPNPGVERALTRVFERLSSENAPRTLARAMHHAIFPAGSRLRSALACAVADSLSGANETTYTLGAAVEVVHAVARVRDELSGFGGRDLGAGTVSATYGRATTILVGDALLTTAFEMVSGPEVPPDVAAAACAMVARAMSPTRGLGAGRALELEGTADITRYHDTKTATLFEIAAMLGALSTGARPEPFGALGRSIGRAYKLARDLAESVEQPAPVGQARGVLATPSHAAMHGEEPTFERVIDYLEQAISLGPDAHSQRAVRTFIREHVSPRLEQILHAYRARETPKAKGEATCS